MPQGALVRGPAFILDTLLCGVVATLILGTQAPLAKTVLVTLAVEFVYFAVCEGVLGTTGGKRLFGLRVVRADDGRPCGPLAAVVRTVLRLVDNILFSLPGVTAILSSPRRQRLGDRAARTLVVSEVPEQLLTALGGFGGRSAFSPEDMARRLNDLALRQQSALRGEPGTMAAPSGEAGAAVPCPFCDQPMSEDEIVCRHCDNYVNQASAHGETDGLAPIPQLYSDDRNLRFDALWRLVFADDEASLEAVREAVSTWPRADRLLAVHAFAEVADRRPIAFLSFMADDREPSVGGLAREVRSRLRTSA